MNNYWSYTVLRCRVYGIPKTILKLRKLGYAVTEIKYVNNTYNVLGRR